MTPPARTSETVDYRDLLPDLLAEVAQAAGLRAALKLRKDLGGTAVHIARQPRAGTLLVDTIGLAAARHLGTLYGGETIIIPKGQRQQAALVRHLLGRGLKVQEVARLVGLHAHSVRRIKHGTTEQLPLFPSL